MAAWLFAVWPYLAYICIEFAGAYYQWSSLVEKPQIQRKSKKFAVFMVKQVSRLVHQSDLRFATPPPGLVAPKNQIAKQVKTSATP